MRETSSAQATDSGVDAGRGDFVRAPGLLVLAAIVVTGIVTGAGYFRYKAPRLKREQEAKLRAAPTTAEGKIVAWHSYGAAQIHHRLTKVPPSVDGRTWIVSHAVLDPAGGPPEIWGVDTSDQSLDLSRVEGLTVIVDLPSPVFLGRAQLQEEAVRNVPRYKPLEPIPDPDARLRHVVEWFLGGLPGALEGDIPGAHLEIRVGQRPDWTPGNGKAGEEADSSPKLSPQPGR